MFTFSFVYPGFVHSSFPFPLYRLDYPGVGPEHSFLKDVGRAEYYSVTDEEALEGRTILYLLPCQMYSDISSAEN